MPETGAVIEGPFTGGCLCGAVRYSATGPALFGCLCHCRDCQRASGAGHVPIMGVTKAGFRLSGTPLVFVSRGGSGHNAVRNSCPRCGSLLFGTPEAAPDLVTVYVGSLDAPEVLRPTEAIHTRSRQPWDTGGAGLRAWPGAAEQARQQ